MKLSKIMAIALAVACLLTGCWQEEPPEEPEDVMPPFEAEEPEKQKDSVLPERFALPYMPGRTLDPIDCPDGMQQVAASLLYEGLFRLDASFTPQSCLCTGYTRDDEAGRYVFTLRSGVLFSDGSPLTGADVKATLERARQSERYGSRLSGIASISASQDTVIVSVFSGPVFNPGFLYRIHDLLHTLCQYHSDVVCTAVDGTVGDRVIDGFFLGCIGVEGDKKTASFGGGASVVQLSVCLLILSCCHHLDSIGFQMVL